MIATLQDLNPWETVWAPYDEATYEQVLAPVHQGETLFEIGAGDLRLARRLALKAARVVAVELHESLLHKAKLAAPLPANLYAVVADARSYPVPPGTTAGVLLMRHCTHFHLYAQKLKEAGVSRLITNARWRMGVEVIDLQAARLPYQQLSMGWYVCWCGAAGFKAGPPEELTASQAAMVFEVADCPQCANVIKLSVTNN